METKYTIPIVLISLMMAGSANAATWYVDDDSSGTGFVRISREVAA